MPVFYPNGPQLHWLYAATMGAVLSVTAIGLACYALTSGVDHGWLSGTTIASVVGAVVLALAPQVSAQADVVDVVALVLRQHLARSCF